MRWTVSCPGTVRHDVPTYPRHHPGRGVCPGQVVPCLRHDVVTCRGPASHVWPWRRSSHTPEVASTCHTSGESNASPVDCQCTNTRSTVWVACPVWSVRSEERRVG